MADDLGDRVSNLEKEVVRLSSLVSADRPVCIKKVNGIVPQRTLALLREGKTYKQAAGLSFGVDTDVEILHTFRSDDGQVISFVHHLAKDGRCLTAAVLNEDLIAFR